MNTHWKSCFFLSALLCPGANALAVHPDSHGAHHHHGHDSHAAGRAPAAVTGDHMHPRGGWMFSYRFMRMDMEDNRDGTFDLRPETIVTTVPNRFFGLPGQPPTLRVVPTRMTTDMHMFGLMHAPTDRLTLMAMLPYLKKKMDHTTYMGGAGSTPLGTFTTRSEGIADLKLAGILGLYDSGAHHVHANVGLGVPTGSNTGKDTILTPMGGRPKVRLPYPMQLGSGTWDLLAGLTYTGNRGDYDWGAQYAGVFRTGSDEGYTLGDTHRASGWIVRQFQGPVSASLRASYLHAGNIDGSDALIVAPVQTADPDRQGRQRLDLSAGLGLQGGTGPLAGQRLALEITRPVYQDLEGPQLKADWMLTASYQYAW